MELDSSESSSEGRASPREGSLTPGDSIAGSIEGAPASPLVPPGQESPDERMDDTSECLFGETSEEESGMQCSSSDGAEPESVGMELGEDSGAETAGIVVRGCRWKPGHDCGEFGSTSSSFSLPLMQVVLTNIYCNLRRLPPTLCKSILSRLRPKAPQPTRNFADFTAAWLLGISCWRVRRTFDEVRGNDWTPTDIQADIEPAIQGPEASPRQDPPVLAPGFALDADGLEQLHLWALRVRVSEAIAAARSGSSDVSYVSAMKRLKKHGLGVGSKYITPHFVERAELMAVQAVGGLAADRLARLVPSLGIPCDFALVFDGVSIGATMFSRHESLTIIGCLIMEDTGGGVWETVAHLLAAPSSGQQHKGTEQAELILQGLADHNANLTKYQLRARMAIIGADGAACAAGGEHPTTGAAEKIWRTVHPEVDPMFPPQAPVTDWDLFHRVDNAMGLAIGDTPCAQAIFDVTRALGALFGCGDGRVIYRSAAAAIKEKCLRVPDQGGSRKVVALSHTVEHLIKTQRPFHAALHARLGQSHGPDARGKQSGMKLTAVGRQICSVNFVTFLVGTGDIMRSCVVPFALSSQKVAGSSQEIDQEGRATIAKLKKAEAALERLTRWTFIATLLFTRLDTSDFKALWGAVSRMDALLPRLAPSLWRMLTAREFSGCTLNVCLPIGNIGGTNHRTLAPHCQCASMRTRPGPPRRATVILRRAPKQPPLRFRLQEVRVPEWVAYSTYTQEEILLRQDFPSPRYARILSEDKPPLELQGISRFRKTVAPCRCVVPDMLPLAANEVFEALFELKRFVARMIYYFTATLLGTRGSSEMKRDIDTTSGVCWDWKFLTRCNPEPRHYKAFFELTALLRPSLRQTEWPNSPKFNFLHQRWPDKKDKNGLMQQYRTLCHRVRNASRLRVRFKSWWKVVEVTVCPVIKGGSCATLRALSQQGPPEFHRISLELRSCLFSLIGAYLGGSPYDSGYFKTKTSTLAAPGCGKTLSKARANRGAQQFSRSAGCFASMSVGSFKGKLVLVLAEHRELDEAALVSSLFGETDFALPFAEAGAAQIHVHPLAVSGDHCWHALRTYMRSRIKAPESVVERWGSLLHMLWDDVCGWQPHRLVTRLFLRASPSIRDDAILDRIVNAIASHLYYVEKLRPFRTPRLEREKKKAELEVSSDSGESSSDGALLRQNLREDGGRSREWWKHHSCPNTLLPAAQRAVELAVKMPGAGRSRPGKRALAELPLFSGEKPQTKSVKLAAREKWLHSASAGNWQAERKKLFPRDKE